MIKLKKCTQGSVPMVKGCFLSQDSVKKASKSLKINLLFFLSALKEFQSNTDDFLIKGIDTELSPSSM